jgi:pyruvate formate lyase activating enzyme
MCEMKCAVCGRDSRTTSRLLQICPACILNKPEDTSPFIQQIHHHSRREFELPLAPPREPTGITCRLCANRCQIGEGNFGYCGLRTVREGKLVNLAGTPDKGLLHWYRDPLPTNCVADWVCEGNRHPGHHNLAVFYQSCTANCLFCQNWHYRSANPLTNKTISALELAETANESTFCVCFFSGDPASQMPHALATARKLAAKQVRVCWETNGNMHPKLLDAAVELSLKTGGTVKFDLKAYDDSLYIALTGILKEQIFDNFTRVAARCREQSGQPLLIASTLLVPGYVDAHQVAQIAAFIARINPDIPYSLLAFAPNFYFADLPCTSREQALLALEAAEGTGLTNIRLGNRHLLGNDY